MVLLKNISATPTTVPRHFFSINFRRICHSVELQSQITRHVERSQIVLKGNACESEIPKGSFFKED